MKNQIQELDGLEIINYQRPKVDLKRKVKVKFSPENIDEICLKSTFKNHERKNTIQELDGLEILKKPKMINIPQCIDELEIEREYDMLLVKPTWNSLQIQGSGLNLLALPRDMGLENQEVDEFEILGMEKPELFIESLETISYEKPTILQKIQVLIPLSENKIDKRDNIRIYGIKKEPEVKIVEKIVEKKVERKVVPNKILKVDKITLKGEEKLDVKKIIKLGSVHLKGRKKTDIRKKVNEDMFQIEGLEKEEYINEIIYVDDIQILGKQKKEEKKIFSC